MFRATAEPVLNHSSGERQMPHTGLDDGKPFAWVVIQ